MEAIFYDLNEKRSTDSKIFWQTVKRSGKLKHREKIKIVQEEELVFIGEKSYKLLITFVQMKSKTSR